MNQAMQPTIGDTTLANEIDPEFHGYTVKGVQNHLTGTKPRRVDELHDLLVAYQYMTISGPFAGTTTEGGDKANFSYKVTLTMSGKNLLRAILGYRPPA